MKLIKGNEAVVYGAILGGATHFFGYPITPASEIAHAASYQFPRVGRFFLQAMSEVNVINMLFGAAAAGSRVMTASSGPGISLMQEGLSYIAGAELPCVVVDVQRAGPGLGNIWPEQGDYNAVVKGGGHGNYRNIVLAPNSAQEMCDFTYKAFDIADKYRNTVFILSDAYIGQIMEPVKLPNILKKGKRKDWALYADSSSRKNVITSILMNSKLQADHNIKLQEKYELIKNEILELEEVETNDAEFIFIAYGICSRICFSVVKELRADGFKVGMVRLKTLFPFPQKRLYELSSNLKKIIVVELSNGQMGDDVELSVNGRTDVLEYNWYGGMVPSTLEIINRFKKDC